MADLVNDLVWSHSRSRSFEGCKRAYWYSYYGSWGGWERAAAAEVRDAYVQKKLTSLPMWTGTVVHRVAEEVLRKARGSEGIPGLEDVIFSLRARCARDVRDSADGSWLQRPSQRVGFREHYYDESVTEAEWSAAVEEIERQVRSLWAHRCFTRLLDVPDRIRELEDLRRFSVGDVDVYVVLDVMVDDGRGGVVILDWKTGGAHDDAEIGAQLGVYGLYASSQLGVAPDAIVALHVNLRHDLETRHSVGPPEIEKARALIGASAAQMRAGLTSIPENTAAKENYPTVEPGSPECTRCTFRGICGRR